MTAIDRQKLIKDAATEMCRKGHPTYSLPPCSLCRSGARYALPVIVAAALEPIRANAALSAIGCRALGDSDGERRWLDLTILLDQIEADCKGGEWL